MQNIFKAQQLFAFTLHQSCYRYAGPAGNYAGNFVFRHAVAQQSARFALLHFLFGMVKLFLQLRQFAVFQFGRLIEVIFAFGALHLRIKVFYLAAYALHVLDGILFLVPFGLELLEFLAVVGKGFLYLFQMLLAQLVGFLFQCRFFNFKLHYLAGKFVKLRGHRVHFRPYQRTCFIHKVYRLVRQETVAYISVRKGCRGYKRVVAYLNAVVNLVALLQAAQYGYCILNARLVHHYRLETAGEGGIFFDVLAVFVKRGCAYAVQLAARKHGLEQIAGIHAAFGFARANYCVQLIDKQYYLAFAALDLAKHGLQPFFKFAAELCAGYQRAHIQRIYFALLQVSRYVPAHYPLRKAFGYCRFTNARLTYQHRIVLGFARQYAYNVPHFVITADNGIELLPARKFNKVLRVFIQRIVCAFWIIGCYPRAAAHFFKGFKEVVLFYVVAGKQFPHGGVRLLHHAKEQMLHGNILVLHMDGYFLGLVQRLVKILRNVYPIRLAAGTGYLRQPCYRRAYRAREALRIGTHALDKALYERILLTKERRAQMLLIHLLIVMRYRYALGGLHRLKRSLRKFVYVHRGYLLPTGTFVPVDYNTIIVLTEK